MPQDIRQGMPEKATPGLSSEYGEHWESAASQCPREQILLVLADERERERVSEWKEWSKRKWHNNGRDLAENWK
jgi:hypothetical protein